MCPLVVRVLEFFPASLHLRRSREKARRSVRRATLFFCSVFLQSVDQALKVIPVAANFSCGAEAALDPDYVKTSALPCVADVNNDGVCDINLGVNRALGQVTLRQPTGWALRSRGIAQRLDEINAPTHG